MTHARLCSLAFFCLSLVCAAHAEPKYPATGLVLRVDQATKTIVVSCNAIPGLMEAKTMALSVGDAKEIENLRPGTMIDFTLAVDHGYSRAESIQIHKYEGLEPDPLAARRLKLLNQAVNSQTKPVEIGEVVPDFTLTARDGTSTKLSKFRGKTVALDFVYTRCALPNFCARTSRNFAVLQEKFHARLAKDLVLLTITFDPVHDTPAVLENYAKTWKAQPRAWYFLTGSEADVRRVCNLFGEDYFPDEGLMDHSLHTAVIDRQRRLVANIEGNDFTSAQLADLVQMTMSGQLTH